MSQETILLLLGHLVLFVMYLSERAERRCLAREVANLHRSLILTRYPLVTSEPRITDAAPASPEEDQASTTLFSRDQMPPSQRQRA